MVMHLDTKSSQAMPSVARVLGMAALVPFALLALAVISAPEMRPEAARALLVYGSVFLSYLGGIRCGLAMREGERAGWSAYGMSALPPVAAWIGANTGGAPGLLILALALGLWFFLERAAPPSVEVPLWYMRLRGALTAVATLAMVAAAFSW